jgi:AcrR family transcriptional regulator
VWYLVFVQERLNRQERKSQTRERLIDAAAQVFADRGFEAASLDEVAAAAGYTKGAVYSNFESKTDLFIALIERRIEVQSTEHAHRFEGLDLHDMARGMGEAADRVTDSDRRWVVLAVEFWLHAMRDERSRLLMAEQYERARTVSAELIVSIYEKAGQKPPLQPRDLAIVIEALSVGLAFQAALDPEHVRLSLQADVLAKLLGFPASNGASAASASQPAAESGSST